MRTHSRVPCRRTHVEQDVVGSIILWNLQSVTHVVSSTHAASRNIAFNIAVPQTASACADM